MNPRYVYGKMRAQKTHLLNKGIVGTTPKEPIGMELHDSVDQRHIQYAQAGRGQSKVHRGKVYE